MTREEKIIYSGISRRGFMGVTAGATLAALAGREPQVAHASAPEATADVDHRALDGRRHGSDRDMGSQTIYAVRARVFEPSRC